MLGESKSEIYKLIPSQYLPRYRLFEPGTLTEALQFAATLGYPLIAKPDVGERGRLVEKIHHKEELRHYVTRCPVPFLLQELVDLPVELGVFFVKKPGESTGHITSLVQKSFMQVQGDGSSTVKELLLRNPRARLQIRFDHPRFFKLMNSIPAAGEIVIVETIGNHNRGTTFLNASGQITSGLHEAISTLCNEIDGFYYGRFDLRCESIDDLERLENFRILELNGAGAEPTHIYHPGGSLWQAYASIFWHLSTLAQISRANKRLGTPYWSLTKGIKKIKMIRSYNQKIRPLL